MKKIIKTTLYIALFGVLVSPTYIFAQNPPRALPLNNNGYQTIQVPQNSASSNTSGQGGNTVTSISGSFGACIAASGLTGMVKQQISKMVGSVLDPRVPTSNSVIEGKDTGSLLTAGISWDQMGWCMVNGLIESISAATVDWINNGFQGNPVFVDDPAQFFGDVADMQAGAFLNDISEGLLCTPIQDLVRINLANSYNSQINRYQNYGNSCSFSEMSGNLEQFMSGETFDWTDWLSYTQDPYNNPYGATIYGGIELDYRIASALNLEQTQLDWSAGFLSKKDPETGKVTSPGSIIEAQVNNRLFSGQRRLEIADEFDEVVNALVNQLIKIAITEMTSQ